MKFAMLPVHHAEIADVVSLDEAIRLAVEAEVGPRSLGYLEVRERIDGSLERIASAPTKQSLAAVVRYLQLQPALIDRLKHGEIPSFTLSGGTGRSWRIPREYWAISGSDETIKAGYLPYDALAFEEAMIGQPVMLRRGDVAAWIAELNVPAHAALPPQTDAPRRHARARTPQQNEALRFFAEMDGLGHLTEGAPNFRSYEQMHPFYKRRFKKPLQISAFKDWGYRYRVEGERAATL